MKVHKNRCWSICYELCESNCWNLSQKLLNSRLNIFYMSVRVFHFNSLQLTSHWLAASFSWTDLRIKTHTNRLKNLVSRWVDPRLSWQSVTGQLETTNLNIKKIWTPDLLYWNSMSDASDFPTPAKTVRLFNDGTVYWAIPGWFAGHCDILAKPFPYDTHDCFMMIGTSTSSNVVLQPLFENGRLFKINYFYSMYYFSGCPDIHAK